MANILITFQPESGQGDTLIEILGKIAHITFLSDIAAEERAKNLSVADILISWNPARELKAEEFGLIAHAKMMQLLSAGVKFATNYPFLELPNVLGSPHNSGIVPGSLLAGTVHAAENVKRFLNKEPVLGVVRRSDYT
jgi:hypothetical protein